jgi:hypothetical protein
MSYFYKPIELTGIGMLELAAVVFWRLVGANHTRTLHFPLTSNLFTLLN